MSEVLKALDKQIADAKQALGQLESKRDTLRHAVIDKALNTADSEHRHCGCNDRDLEFGTWKCNRSPIGICVYDMNSDMRDDDCLFCHNPDERK